MSPGQPRKSLIYDELPRDGVLRFSDITRMLGFASRTTLLKRLRAGEFPPPKRVSGHVRYWSAKDIRAYLDGRTDWRKTQEDEHADVFTGHVRLHGDNRRGRAAGGTRGRSAQRGAAREDMA